MEDFVPFTKLKCNSMTGWSRYTVPILGKHIGDCHAHIDACENLIKGMQAELLTLRSIQHQSPDQLARQQHPKEFMEFMIPPLDDSSSLFDDGDYNQNVELLPIEFFPSKRRRDDDTDDSPLPGNDDSRIMLVSSDNDLQAPAIAVNFSFEIPHTSSEEPTSSPVSKQSNSAGLTSCCICKLAVRWLPMHGSMPRRRDSFVLVSAIKDSKRSDILKRNGLIEENGNFHCHSSCLTNLCCADHMNEPREAKSIWKSDIFQNFLDEDVGNRIVHQGICISLSKLKDLFSVRLQNGCYLDENRELNSKYFKKKILDSQYGPEIMFLTPKNAVLSEVVINKMGRTNLADYYHAMESLLPTNVDGSDDDDSDGEHDLDPYDRMEEDNEEEARRGLAAESEDIEWFHMALKLKLLLKDANRSRSVKLSDIPRPPEFKEDAVRKFVPQWLFNLLAVITNSLEQKSNQVKSDFILENPHYLQTGTESYVPVGSNNKHKIMSLAQDILFLRSKGHCLTPKHVGFAIWLWHKFKSSILIEHIHALGHCISYSSTMLMVTLIANNQQEKKKATPTGIRSNIPFSCACDNLDFKNETTDGSGQTHLLSSIFTQYATEEEAAIALQLQDEVAPITGNPTKSMALKRFQPIEEEITPCSKGKKTITPFERGPDGLTPHERPGLNGNLSDCELGKILINKFSRLDILISLVKNAFRMLNIPFILPDWIGVNMWINPRSPNNTMVIAPTPCTVSYGPMIHADPNAPSTINHFLKTVIAARAECEIDEIALTADMSLYEKILPIINENREYSCIMPMVGDMHMDMSFFCILGKVFEGSGYDTIIKRANLVAEGSMAQVINGKHINRATRTHEIMGEALECMRFRNWLFKKYESVDEQEIVYHRFIRIIVGNENPEELDPNAFISNIPNLHKVVFQSDYNNEVNKIMDDYMDWVREQCDVDPTFSFWSLLIHLINLVVKLHGRAVKSATSNEFMWLLYVETVAAMMPYFHYYNQTHYRRYLSWFVVCLKFLKEKQPRLYKQFMEGKYAVRRNSHNNFSDCPMDQTLEHGPNREAKVVGGIGQGRTQRPGESQRWMASLPVVSQIAGNFSSDVAGLSHHSRLSKHLDGPQILKHENFVKSILSIVDKEMIDDPFSGHTQLVNICSGEIATDAVSLSYKECERIGKAAETKIISERWILNQDIGGNVSMDAPIPKIRNDTWSKHNHPNTRKVNAGSGKVENSTIVKLPAKEQFAKSIFLGMLLMSEEQPPNIDSRRLTRTELMSFPLCTYPASISLPNGLFYQTSKAGLRQNLIDYAGKNNSTVNSTQDHLNDLWFSRSGVYIVDAMAVITPFACMARSSASPKTFRDFAIQVLKKMVLAAKHHGCAILHIVADTYKPGDTKLLKHQARRGNKSENRIKILKDGTQQSLPKSQNEMKSYMACDENKNELIQFLFEISTKEEIFNLLNHHHGHPEGLVIFFAHGDRCHRISRDLFPQATFRVDEVPGLASDHGEADGRLILHSLFAARELLQSSGPGVAATRQRIIIESEDTDNLVIAICHSNAIASALGTSVDDAIATFCMFLGTKNVLVDIFAIAFVLGPELSVALPGFHAVTGCDTTSYFKGIGKKVPWDVFLERKQIFTSALTALGSSREPLSRDVMADLEAFVCRFYRSSTLSPGQVVTNANELRALLFDAKTNLGNDEKLPPTRDCLQCHFQRAHFQALQWRLSDKSFMNLPDAALFGFQRCNDGQLSVVWYTGNMLPQVLHTQVSCSCKKSKCISGVCRCHKLNLLCNSSCKCDGCENCATNTAEEETEKLEADEEEEDEEMEDDQSGLDSDDENDINF